MNPERPRFNEPSQNQGKGKGEAITKFFKDFGESFKHANKEGAIKNAFRIDAAEAGFPIKPYDVQRLSLYKKEFESLSGKKKVELEQQFKDYKIPNLADVFNKDQNGKLLMNEDKIDEYRWAMAVAELEKMGIHDFRQAEDLEIQSHPSHPDRIAFTTGSHLPDEKLSYEIKRLLFAVTGESRDGDKEFTILPYAHNDKENHIGSKSILVFNDAQRKKLREFAVNYLKKNL